MVGVDLAAAADALAEDRAFFLPPDELVALLSVSSTTRCKSCDFRPRSSVSEGARLPSSFTCRDVASVVIVRIVPYWPALPDPERER
jgi:hypothetical protein